MERQVISGSTWSGFRNQWLQYYPSGTTSIPAHNPSKAIKQLIGRYYGQGITSYCYCRSAGDSLFVIVNSPAMFHYGTVGDGPVRGLSLCRDAFPCHWFVRCCACQRSANSHSDDAYKVAVSSSQEGSGMPILDLAFCTRSSKWGLGFRYSTSGYRVYLH